MKCADVMKKISVYAEGQTGPWESARLRSHIEKCDSCRKWLETLETLQPRLSEALQEEVETPDIARSVMEYLPVQRRQTVSVWVWAPVAAVFLIAAIVIGFSLWPTQPKQIAKNTPTIQQTPTKALPKPDVHVAEKPKIVAKQPKKMNHRYIRPTQMAVVPKPPATVKKVADKNLVTTDKPDDILPMVRSETVREIVSSPDGAPIEIITTNIIVGDMAIRQSQQVISSMMPDKDTANIKRPPLELFGTTRSDI